MDTKVISLFDDTIIKIIDKIILELENSEFLTSLKGSCKLKNLSDHELRILDIVDARFHYQIDYTKQTISWVEHPRLLTPTSQYIKNKIIKSLTFDLKWIGITIKENIKIIDNKEVIEEVEYIQLKILYDNNFGAVIYYCEDCANVSHDSFFDLLLSFLTLLKSKNVCDIITGINTTDRILLCRSSDLRNLIKYFGCNITYPKKIQELIKNNLQLPCIDDLNDIILKYIDL